jgi:hypothetical protein
MSCWRPWPAGFPRSPWPPPVSPHSPVSITKSLLPDPRVNGQAWGAPTESMFQGTT